MHETPSRKTSIFHRLESNVRGYCRSFPAVFVRAKNALLYDEEGKEYVDFLAGAGTLSYGHNHPDLKQALLAYIESDGLTHGLDMFTAAKRDFLEAMQEVIFKPRELDYKIQFTGPTGTNAVEAAMKIARNVTGRTNIVAFTNGFHGVTLGSVAATGNSHYRGAAGVPLQFTTFMPYDGYFGEHVDTMAYFERMLLDNSSGLERPAGVIVETIQGEGGVNEASYEWLRKLERVCNANDIPLIVDDIQVGSGRTGRFFSFEEAQISPDIVTLSKSLSGYGLPLSVVLMKPHMDTWKPGEHNGTFRGNNLAFVTAAAMLHRFWSDREFGKEVQQKSWLLGRRLHELRDEYPSIVGVRGRGLIFGVQCPPSIAAAIQRAAFEEGLIIETCGALDQVLKFLPPLTIEIETLERGLDIFEKSLRSVFARSRTKSRETAEARR